MSKKLDVSLINHSTQDARLQVTPMPLTPGNEENENPTEVYRIGHGQQWRGEVPAGACLTVDEWSEAPVIPTPVDPQ